MAADDANAGTGRETSVAERARVKAARAALSLAMTFVRV
jgi:hypothetical protein